MKLILLAAAALIATPALAQTQPQSGTTGTSTPDTNMPAQSTTGSDSMPQTPTSGTDGTMPSQGSTQGSTSNGSMSNGRMSTSGTPAGGYQPSAMPMSGAPAAGSTVRFQQAPTPDQAYPAPAALASYPICKRGQFDQCMQASDAGHRGGARAMHRRRR